MNLFFFVAVRPLRSARNRRMSGQNHILHRRRPKLSHNPFGALSSDGLPAGTGKSAGGFSATREAGAE